MQKILVMDMFWTGNLELLAEGRVFAIPTNSNCQLRQIPAIPLVPICPVTHRPCLPFLAKCQVC